jgi:hypothetical protein
MNHPRQRASGNERCGVQHSATREHQGCNDVRDRERRNGVGRLAPSGVQDSAIGANRVQRHDDRIVPLGGQQTHAFAGEHRNGDGGLAPSGVQHSAIGANRVH